MAWFSARTISASTVPVDSEQIWEILTDPSALAELTPLIRSIEASGDHWLWKLNSIEALGLKMEAAFTERMEFTNGRHIVFAHDPPEGKKEQAAVEGTYEVTPAGAHNTDLKVDLTLSVQLPLPRLARHGVERVIHSAMRVTGKQFAKNLYDRLGLDPADATIEELAIP